MLRRAFLRRMIFAALATWFVELPLPASVQAGTIVSSPEEFRDAWISEVRTYGSEGGRDLELVMQDILDDWAGGVALSVSHSPGFVVLPYDQGPMEVADALQRLADLIGWNVEWGGDGPRLVEPERPAAMSPNVLEATRRRW